MYMVLFVLNDAEKLDDLLDAWESAGAPGITVLYSSGLGRIRTNGGLRDDMPLFPSLDSFLHHEEYLSRTLFTVVDSDALVERIVAATQTVTGDLMQPHTGLLVVLPIHRAFGLTKGRS